MHRLDAEVLDLKNFVFLFLEPDPLSFEARAPPKGKRSIHCDGFWAEGPGVKGTVWGNRGTPARQAPSGRVRGPRHCVITARRSSRQRPSATSGPGPRRRGPGRGARGEVCDAWARVASATAERPSRARARSSAAGGPRKNSCRT